jgi:hypothetical protein
MPIALCDLKPAAEETSLDEAVRATVGNLRSEVESLVPAYERLYGAQSRSNAAALDRIATMLQDPEWGSGMLEDIAEEVQRTGRSLDGDGDPTWDRH